MYECLNYEHFICLPEGDILVVGVCSAHSVNIGCVLTLRRSERTRTSIDNMNKLKVALGKVKCFPTD